MYCLSWLTLVFSAFVSHRTRLRYLSTICVILKKSTDIMFCASFLEKFVGIIKEKGHLNWMDGISISFSITYFWDISFLFYFWCLTKSPLPRCDEI